MQPLKNDMDHLMRQAAENYSLQPSGQNWQAVADQLDAAEPAPAKGAALQNSRRYGMLLLFLLTSLVCNKYLHLSTRFAQMPYSVSNNMLVPAETKKIVNDAVTSEEPNTHTAAQVIENSVGSKNVSKSFYPVEFKRTVAKTIAADVVQTNEVALMKWDKAGISGIKRSSHFDLDAKKLQNPFAGVDFAQKESMPESSKNRMRWYAGVVAGPDLTTVNFSAVESAGFSAGVVLGYNINKKWSVETGLLWDRKSYYADGKDFNTSKLQLPSHSNIISAEGYCNMFEIPVNVRYRFRQGGQHNWFASAGASSYLMQKEEYDYLYERYNVQYNSSKYYQSSLQHWLAVANISAGYERTWSRGSTLRVEPYLKVPLKGMGTGKLPLTSTGVQVGFTHPIR